MSWINENKTKILGILIIIVSFIQSDQTLVNQLTPDAYAWVMRICGLLALIFGFLNGNANKESR